MITVRRAGERGHTVIDWLDSWHTFSFDTYHDPRHENFRSLRVINEDIVKAGAGFHPHSHRDMEILTYIIEGSLEHGDNLSHGSVIRPGEVQRMSAGTGVTHSEFNHSKKDPVHLLQIWILPEKKGLTPGYEQRAFSEKERQGRLCLVASNKPANGALKIHQDVQVYASLLQAKESLPHSLRPGRHAWIQVARGEMDLNGNALGPGDGAAMSEEKNVSITAKKDAEILLFDLA